MEFSQQLFVSPLILIVDKLGEIAAGFVDGEVVMVWWFDGWLIFEGKLEGTLEAPFNWKLLLPHSLRSVPQPKTGHGKDQ